MTVFLRIVKSHIFVMDVCQVNDELSVLEIGDLHSCGWYASNKKDIIKEVTDHVEKTYCPVA